MLSVTCSFATITCNLYGRYALKNIDFKLVLLSVMVTTYLSLVTNNPELPEVSDITDALKY